MCSGGKQARPDAPYARKILGVGGRLLGEVGEGNRKDIRDAVEAAHAAAGWAHTTGHNRGQVLYYMAENLAVRAEEFAGQLEALTGRSREGTRRAGAATELDTVLEASDLPNGVVNIVTGAKDTLAQVLAEHDDVDAVWYFGNQPAAAQLERASAGNMKRTWVEWQPRNWMDCTQGEGREFLRKATQVKNIWIPYGD